MVLLGVALAGVVIALVALVGRDSGAADEKLVVVRGGETVNSAPAARLRSLSRAELEDWITPLVRTRAERRGTTHSLLRTDRDELLDRVQVALREGRSRVDVPERTVAASTRLPVVRQRLRNNCETAALSMLLFRHGVKEDQLALQRALPESGPPDPQRTARGEMLWGDPNRGFVGRADGGGTAGGYGVYERPIGALAASRGVRLDDVGGGKPERVYRRLLTGRPVLVWVGLSEGPYETWRTPEGRQVRGNFGEHTVVLTGLRRGKLEVNDPLDGKRKTWSRAEFERLWPRLGRRALSS